MRLRLNRRRFCPSYSFCSPELSVGRAKHRPFPGNGSGNTEKCRDNSGREKPHKTLKIRAGKMAVTVEILPR